LRRGADRGAHAPGGLSRRRRDGVLTPDGFHTATITAQPVNKAVHEVEWDLAQIEKGGFEHFMLKEIFEQPDAVRNSMRGRLDTAEGLARLGGLNMTAEEMREIKRENIHGRGTSGTTRLVGQH